MKIVKNVGSSLPGNFLNKCWCGRVKHHKCVAVTSFMNYSSFSMLAASGGRWIILSFEPQRAGQLVDPERYRAQAGARGVPKARSAAGEARGGSEEDESYH